LRVDEHKCNAKRGVEPAARKWRAVDTPTLTFTACYPGAESRASKLKVWKEHDHDMNEHTY